MSDTKAETEKVNENAKTDPEDTKTKEKEKTVAKIIDEGYISKIQNKLNTSNTDVMKSSNKQVEDAAAKVRAVKNFEEYFRPYQEQRTLMWNELGKANHFDLPINKNAGRPLMKADYSQSITLHFNSASKEQMQHIENLRAKSQDLDRIERLSNTMSTDLMEKKGLKIPKNYLTVSAEAAIAKEDLLHARIVIFCGVDEDTAKEIAIISDSQSLDQILDAWEYRNRTGFPNLKNEPIETSSQSGYQ